MPYSEWPYVEAQRILDRLQKIGRATVTTETGYGPSGLPHLGTFGEVARTSFVLQALKTLAPHVESKLIAFSDDMDGLREVPQNVPNRQMLVPHLGKPLTSVPDPFGQEPSYAHFMNKRLREFLDSFGFRYDFASSTEQYRSGRFNDAIRRVMQHYDEIREMFVATIAEEKRATWSPFFPVCGKCGRIYSTRVTGIDRTGLALTYACDTPLAGRYECCGHTGSASVLDGGCKLGWKVDWALRWFALGIDYETHGEDLLDSVRLSSRIVKVIGGEPPETFKYELFLDEKGKKISKKLGNGVSIEQWLKYAPVDSLLYLMFDKPQQAKKMGLPLLPEIVDQYLELVSTWGGDMDSPVPFVSRLSSGPHAETGRKSVPYSMIVDLVMSLGTDDPALLREFLLRYQPDVAANLDYLDRLIKDALTYTREVLLPTRKAEAAGHELDAALKTLVERLRAAKAAAASAQGAAPDAEVLQTLVFQVAKDCGVQPKEWFRTLYRIFLGQSQGPRLGSFIALLGIDKAAERIEAHLTRA